MMMPLLVTKLIIKKIPSKIYPNTTEIRDPNVCSSKVVSIPIPGTSFTYKCTSIHVVNRRGVFIY